MTLRLLQRLANTLLFERRHGFIGFVLNQCTLLIVMVHHL